MESADQPRTHLGWLLTAMLLPGVAMLLSYYALPDRFTAPIYTASKALVLALPLWLLRPKLRELPACRGKDVALGLTVGALVGAAALALYWGLLRGTPGFLTAARAVDVKLDAAYVDTPLRFVLMAVFVCIVNAGLEEYFWRWFAFGELRKHSGPLAAALVTSLMFGLHHAVVLSKYFDGHPWTVAGLTLGTVLGGVMWCWMYQARGTLYAGLLSHLVIDVAVMSIAYDMLFVSLS